MLARPPGPTLAPVPLSGPAGAATGSAWASEVFAALDHLEPLQSEALRLVYFQRCTLEDAAVRLDVSTAALDRRVSAGMRALADALI